MAPDKYIRKAIQDAMAVVSPVLVTDQVLPISENTPPLQVQINTQSRNRTAISKQNYEWLCSVTLSLVKVNEKGYISSVDLDDLDSQVVSVMDTLAVPGFKVNFSRFFDSVSDVIESPANTINRKHIIYELWLNRIV